jgi:hypothetical protein
MATTNYSWNLPTVGGSEDAWGTQLNANWTALDTLLGGVTQSEFALLDGATVTTAELNVLDGVTASTAEINYLSGVTSAVQTQIDAKATETITVSAGAGLTGGGDLSANRTISHADTSSQASVNNSGTTFIQDITLDTYGHVTAIGSTTVPASTPASARGIGSYTVAWYAVSGNLSDNTYVSIAVGTTIAGSSLRSVTSATASGGTSYPAPFSGRSASTNTFPSSNTETLSGTWRLMTSGKYRDRDDPPDGGTFYGWYLHLWLRIS